MKGHLKTIFQVELLPTQRALFWQMSTVTVQSLFTLCHHWNFKMSPEHNSTDLKSFVYWNTWTMTVQSFLGATAECPVILKPFYEYNSTESRSSVSQKTWTKNIQSLLPSVTNEWLCQDLHSGITLSTTRARSHSVNDLQDILSYIIMEFFKILSFHCSIFHLKLLVHTYYCFECCFN